MSVKKPGPVGPFGHPAVYEEAVPRTKASTGCDEDALIREHGFTIASRRPGVVLWKRGEKFYTHGDALAVAQSAREKALRALEEANR